jgi:alkanesulfonate monooxygenase SsuD/methylene tetrahydromethanopterin reductase-like flavin-dependent oxidoreductase (luciferase family)
VTGLQVDLLLDPFGARWPEMRDAAWAAAGSGFAGLWTYDHLDGRVYGADHVLEGWTVLTALATTVPDVVIGPLVLNVANRHPAVLAVMAATLQEVSGGRLLLGIGAGAQPGTPYAREQEALGRPVVGDAARRADVEACAADLHRVWHAPGFLRPDPEPPLVVAAFGRKMAEVAGRVGDGINVRAGTGRHGELMAIALEAHRRGARRDRPFLLTVFSVLTEHWLSTATQTRDELAALGVHRLVLAVGVPFDRAHIEAAGRRLQR